jgi:hypothetical protein
MSAPVMNFAQFCKVRGLTGDHDVLGHAHEGLGCRRPSKAAEKRHKARLRQLQDARDDARREYFAAIDRGEIAAQPRRTTEQIAAGDPDKKSTQAAIRILEKRKARAAQEGSA